MMDYVPMPANTDEHWILLRLDLKARILFVYDSIQFEDHDDNVKGKLQCYYVLLPFFLNATRVWKIKTRTKGKAEETNKTKPLPIVWLNYLFRKQISSGCIINECC